MLKKHLRSLCVFICGLILLAFISFAVWLGYIYFGLAKGPVHEIQNSATTTVTDVTGLYAIQTKGIIVPHSTEEISQAVANHERVSIGGGRYSMGGQTASEKAVQIDMREFNKIVNISTSTKEITVQAGIRWRDIQDAIDPYDLSVQIMQTYSNFTVGGSLSVNVHGRYIGQGPEIMSVKKIQIVLADGGVVEATPDTNKDLFYSAIGGMGGMGVITEVTLGLADNVHVERNRIKIPIEDYKQYFFDNVRNSTDVVFHNGDIYPMDFDSVSVVNWKKTDKPLTIDERLIPRKKDYWIERAAWIVMSEWPFGKAIREYVFEPLIYSKDAVHTRNYEASYDVAELEPQNREKSTYVLQEYFVPVEKFDEFYPVMKEVFAENDVNLLNVSIRHANKDPGSLLAWARNEVFAFVVYYKQGTDDGAKDKVARWTREMIDEVIKVGGSYYLPYQPWATDEQFHRAYPQALEFFELKKLYDPTNKFTNNLWETYYSPEKLEKYKEIRDAAGEVTLPEDYVRKSDNIYVTIPEWYIVYSAVEYANVLETSLPSHFDYRAAVKQYWTQYEKTQELTTGSQHQNADYGLVLQVIGWSFTFENNFKWVYEQTIGSFTEWLAGNKQSKEDEYAAEVARAYALFIYDKPWYDFPFHAYFKGINDISAEGNEITWGERIRKLERRLFLGVEYGVKSVYAKVIQMASNAKFGLSDDQICALIIENEESDLLCAPHYQPFTRALLEKIDGARDRQSVMRVLEIAGNNKITFVYLDEQGASVPTRATEIVRHREVQRYESGEPVYKDRITVLVNVEDIVNVVDELAGRSLAVDHFYDY
jgi:FAD/FMN-containing dehydrogenase